MVLSVDGNFNYNTDQNKNINCTCPINPGVSDSFSFYNRVQGSLVGRIGYALMNNQLFSFVKAGGSLANLGLKYYNENGDNYNNNSTEAGWVIGAGVEWKMTAAWSLRLEYTYIDYHDINMRINTIGLAVNYWV